MVKTLVCEKKDAVSKQKKLSLKVAPVQATFPFPHQARSGTLYNATARQLLYKHIYMMVKTLLREK